MEHKIQIRLSRLLLTSSEQIITVAKDMKIIGKQIEITDGIDYIKEDFIKKYDGNKMISRWCNTIDNEDKKEKLVIIL